MKMYEYKFRMRFPPKIWFSEWVMTEIRSTQVSYELGNHALCMADSGGNKRASERGFAG